MMMMMMIMIIIIIKNLTSYENMKWIRVAMAAVYMCANSP
jgi:hypothetical protein